MLISIIKLGINYFGNKIVNRNCSISIALNADLANRIKVNDTKKRVNSSISTSIKFWRTFNQSRFRSKAVVSQTFCARGTLCYLSKFCGTRGPECRSFLVYTEFPRFPLPDAL